MGSKLTVEVGPVYYMISHDPLWLRIIPTPYIAVPMRG